MSATFRVGDRVKVISYDSLSTESTNVGRTGTVSDTDSEYIFVNMTAADAYSGNARRRRHPARDGAAVTTILKRIAQLYVDLAGAFLLMLLMASAIALWLASLWAPLYLAANHSPWFLLLLLLAPLTTVAMLTPFTTIATRVDR
jgi:hypothetical protein